MNSEHREKETYLTLALVDQVDASAKAIRDLGGDALANRVREFATEVRQQVAAGQSIFTDETLNTD